ncbi:MAG: phosphoribosyltransferase [Promethearchaeota archaeon]|jgi:predicted phosphoribosyltransferase
MKFKKYESRIRAGEILADFIKNEKVSIGAHLINNIKQYFCFAIPNGGVPVAEGFCSRFKLYYDILIVRKIKIPFNTEAGYGAITTDGTVLFNKPLLNRLNLSEKEINDSINMTKKEISERTKLYNKEPNLRQFYIEKIQNKYVFILDDGLASGFTMLAAINMVKKYQPLKISIVIPTAPLRTVKKIQPKVDGIFCPNIGDVMWFAVADAYKNWYDVPESEVLKILNNSKHYVSNFKRKTSH